MKVLILGWIAATAVILLWPQPANFNQRWPTALPPAMSLQTFNAARN
jgi:hypothetical protein